MIRHTIICEICDEPLVKAHLPNLKRPLVASLFEPLDPGHQFPFPDPDTNWEWMRCPHCQMRPFIVSDQEASLAVEGKWPGPEQVKTLQGMYRIYDHTYPGVPPQVNVQIHSDEELEKEWAIRSTKPKDRNEETPPQKPSTKSSPEKDRQAQKMAARKAKRQKNQKK